MVLHGMFADHNAMNPLCNYLKNAGFLQVEAPDLTPVDGSKSITLLAEQLDAKVHAFVRRTGAQKIDLVGYSLGAMVARYWLARDGGTRWTRRFVSLAGPQQGVLGGLLSTRVLAEELRPLSPFLLALERDHRSWGGVQVASFFSPFDAVILPTETAIVPRSHLVHACLAPSHHQMATDPQVLSAVAAVLERTPMSVPLNTARATQLSRTVTDAIARHLVAY